MVRSVHVAQYKTCSCTLIGKFASFTQLLLPSAQRTLNKDKKNTLIYRPALEIIGAHPH